jgi:hypothetical protein
MRLISFSAGISFALLSSLALSSLVLSPVVVSSEALAQQSPGAVGETIGHPPPIPGPPPASTDASSAPAASAAPASEPAPKGYTGAYEPPGPPKPYYKGPLPLVDNSAGLNVAAPDGSTKTVKAIPCSTAARETDGITTCVGIPDTRKGR